MLIASYEQWEAEQRQIVEQENPLLECRRCDGEGEIIEDCPCCGHEKEEECPTCEGAGQIRYEDAPIGLQREQIEPWMYFDQVIADLKKWCAYTREDFLKVAGGFVNEFRKQHGRV